MADVTVAEAETFIYASRSDGPAQAGIFRIKEAVPLAALPSKHNELVLNAIQHVFPQFIDGVDVLHTGMNNMGAIFHPALTLLNAGRIESTAGEFQFYIDGVTPSVARVLEVLDRERVTVASALGIRARTAMDWLQMAYNTSGETLHEAIHNQPGYFGINAPSTLNHRYIFEDVPMSLVPIASLGQHYGVSVRGMDSIIRLACIVHRTDYWQARSKLALENTLSELNAQHEIKKLQLESAKLEHDRNRQLFAEGLTSSELLRKSEVAERQAGIELQRIEASRLNAQESTKTELAGLALELAKLEKAHQEARRVLGLATPRADRIGVVTWTLTEEGAAVRKGDIVARVADLSAFRVDASVSDAYASRLSAGLPALVRVDDRVLDGRVTGGTRADRRPAPATWTWERAILHLT